MTPEQLLLIAQAKRKRAEAEAATSGTAPAQPAQPAQRMDAQSSRSVLLENGIDPARVNDWYNGAENRDGTGAQIPSWKTAPAADPTKPTPPPALWEAPVNVAKAVDTPDEARARALVGRRIDGVGPRTPDPTQAPISEQQLSSQTYWNAEKPPEPMNNLVKRAAIGVTNILSDTGNMIMEGAEAIQALRTYDPKDPMSRRMQGAPPPPVKPGPRIPMIYKPEAQNFEQAAADVTGIIGGLALPLGPVSNTFRAGGQALRSTNTIGRAAAAITPQGTSALDRTIRLGGRTAAMAPEAAATAFGAGAILGGENMGGDGDRLQSGVEFASDPINYIAQPAAMLLNRAGIFIKSAGQRVTPEVVQVQRAQEVLRRANATAAEQAAAARVIDELTPPNPQATVAPTALAAAQPSVAPVVQPNVVQGAPRTAQAGPAGAGQQAAAGAGAAQPVLNAVPVAPAANRQQALVARDTAKILTRIMRAANLKNADIRGYLPGAVQRYKSLNDSRVPFAFFLESDLPKNFAEPVAADIVTKLQGWGRARNAAMGKGDTSAQITQGTIKELRGSQQDFLTQSAEANLYKGSLISQEDQILKSLRETGKKGYEPVLAYARDAMEGRRVPNAAERAGFEELRGVLGRPVFRDRIPNDVRMTAEAEGLDILELIERDPVTAAHWLQSNLNKLEDAAEINGRATPASLAYGKMRADVLEPLKKAAPGYEGALNRYGHEWGAKNAVRFGKGLFTEARSAYDTGQKVRAFKRLGRRQQTVAWKSIRDEFLNEFRGTAEDAAAKITRMQQEGALDLLEQLGARGKRFADDIRRIAQQENPSIRAIEQASNSLTFKNLSGAEAAREMVQSPVNQVVGSVTDKASWPMTIAADAVVIGTTGIPVPMLTASKLMDRFGNPGPQTLSRATEGLYGLPPKVTGGEALPAIRAPRTGGGKPKPAPAPAQQDLGELLKALDEVEKDPKRRGGPEGKRLMDQIEAVRTGQATAPAKPRRVKGAAPAAPTTPAKAKPPLPGQQSSSPPMIGGAALGALTSGGATYAATGDEDAAFKAGILGGIGGGVVGSRLAKGSTPKPPAVKPRPGPPGVKPPPVKNGFGSRDLPMDEASRMGRAREMGFNVDTPLYHGTNKNFDEFDTSAEIRNANEAGSAVYLTPDPEAAGSYAKGWREAVFGPNEITDGENIRPVYARLRNPYTINVRSQSEDLGMTAEEAASIRAAGYDGIIVRTVELDGQGRLVPGSEKPFEYVVFDPKNIRGKFAKFDPSEYSSSKLLAGMSGNSRGLADNLKQDAGIAALGSVGGSFANQDDPQAGALGGMGLALGAKYGGRAVNAVRGRGKAPPASAGKFRGPSQQTFAGVNAKTADKVALARAQNMEAEGASREDILDETGWFKQHGDWKFEIDDSGAQLRPGAEVGANGNLARILDDADAGGAYPDLNFASAKTNGQWIGGGYVGPSSINDEVMWAGRGGNGMRSNLLHERQHAVQNREGFAPGGSMDSPQVAQYRMQLLEEGRANADRQIQAVMAANPREAKIYAQWERANKADSKDFWPLDKKLKQTEAGRELAKLYNDKLNTRIPGPEKVYRSLAGEVEARNVETRRDFTPEQRRARRPWETQDVPDDQQIVRFGSGKAESRPKPPPKGQKAPPKGPSFPPRLAADLNKSKVSPATRATLDQNAALPPGERKSVMEATGWSDDILRIAAPYIRPGTRMESEVGNRIARLVQQANANPVEYALRQTMAKGALEEAQKRFKQASGARSRAANNLENLRSRNMLNPNQPATQQQLTVHKQRRDDAEQFLSEAARLRDEAKVMLDRADVELMSLPQVRDFANKEIQRITDALGVGGKASPGTAQLPSYNPMVKGPKPIPKPGAVNRPSKRAADELAHLLFEQDMAEKFAKIQSGEITPTQRNTFQQVMSWYARHPSLAAGSAALAGASGVGYAALATDQGERAVQARENARKRSGQPEPELPGPPAWDWEKLSRNPRFAGDTQAALQALGYKIGKIDNNIRRADGKRTESEKALYHFLWTMDNTRDPEAPPTEAEWDALKEAALQARRKR